MSLVGIGVPCCLSLLTSMRVIGPSTFLRHVGLGDARDLTQEFCLQLCYVSLLLT